MFNFNQFYRMFEDRYRGSTGLIKDRLSFYLPFILPLKEVYPQNFAVDLGSGRGEWVEMLAENGFSPTGVDTNDEMFEDSKREDIVFENRDALDFLKSLPDESQSLITAFHLIEHVPFSYLAELLLQIERVLLPGGLLILETPNPENIHVATETFYLDPSHLHPVPIQFISFLVDYVGIKRQNIVRLQEPAHILEDRIAVGDLLMSVSPDYGIVAQKHAAGEILDKFSLPFEQSYGISFADLSKALDKQTQEDFEKIEDVINEKTEKVKLDTMEQVKNSSTEMKELITTQFGSFSSDLQNHIKQTVENSFSQQIPELIERYTEISKKMAQDAETIDSQFQQIQALKGQVNELENKKHNRELEIQKTTTEQQGIVDELINVYASKSFRLTRPLRALARWMRKVGRKIFGITDSKSKQPDVQECSAHTEEDLSGSELAEDTEYFYGVLKDLMGKNK